MLCLVDMREGKADEGTLRVEGPAGPELARYDLFCTVERRRETNLVVSDKGL